MWFYTQGHVSSYQFLYGRLVLYSDRLVVFKKFSQQDNSMKMLQKMCMHQIIPIYPHQRFFTYKVDLFCIDNFIVSQNIVNMLTCVILAAVAEFPDSEMA